MMGIGVRGRARHAAPNRPTRWQLKAGVVLAVAAGLVASVLPTERAQAADPVPVAVATFDYSMPPRYVDGGDGDSFPDGFYPRQECTKDADDNWVCESKPAVNPRPIVPDSWHVDLNACATEGVAYAWTVLGYPTLQVTGGPACDAFDLEVPAEGTYKVGLTVTKADGSKAYGMQEVVVQDFLIISLGDSYGSGEGNPHVEGQFIYTDDVVWGDRRCRRSSWAGSSRAAAVLEASDPRTSVTFVHLACSGAQATVGLLEPYVGIEGEPEAIAFPPAEPQIKVAKQLIGDRELDALYVSIGGNDAYFSKIVMACMGLDPCNSDTLYPSQAIIVATCAALSALAMLATSPAGAAIFGIVCGIALDVIVASALETAPALVQAGFVGGGVTGQYDTYRITDIYQQVDDALFATWQSDDVALGLPERHRNRVALSEYVDATRDDDGSFCWADEALPGVDEAEYIWLDANVEQELNRIIRWNAESRGYGFVDGIYDGFKGHGTCADDSYMVSFKGSLWAQQDINGTAHPNANGHAVYRNRILRLWLSQLYPDGQGGAPDITNANIDANAKAWVQAHAVRKPEQAPVPVPGGAYTVDEGSDVATTNQSYDDQATLTHLWSTAQPAVATVKAPAAAATPALHGEDDGTTAVTLQVTDDLGNVSSADTSVTVKNVAPVLSSVTVPTTPVLNGTPATATAVFSDAGVHDTHTVTWNWGDGTTSTTASAAAGGGSVSATHTYAVPGLYVVTASVRDDDGGTSGTVQASTLVPVFDPSAGFVSGGGKVPSPAGSYKPQPSASGTAQFSFTTKYIAGAMVPKGQTSFTFKVGGFSFDATSYDWMVVARPQVFAQGTGTVNGKAGHRFLLSVVDGGKKPDFLRMKVWETATGTVVYDNGAGLDNAKPVAPVQGNVSING